MRRETSSKARRGCSRPSGASRRARTSLCSPTAAPRSSPSTTSRRRPAISRRPPARPRCSVAERLGDDARHRAPCLVRVLGRGGPLSGLRLHGAVPARAAGQDEHPVRRRRGAARAAIAEDELRSASGSRNPAPGRADALEEDAGFTAAFPAAQGAEVARQPGDGTRDHATPGRCGAGDEPRSARASAAAAATRWSESRRARAEIESAGRRPGGRSADAGPRGRRCARTSCGPGAPCRLGKAASREAPRA